MQVFLIKNVWFPDKKVQKGDFIVLYTKSGNESDAKNKMGTISHTFYWGLKETIWHEKGGAAVLLEVKSWDAKKVIS